MATEAAGAPAAAAAAPGAAPAPAGQQVLSAAERIERGEAAVRQEFIRSVGARVHVGAVTGGGLAAAPGATAEAKVAAAGQGERQLDARSKSKKQAKKVRGVAWQRVRALAWLAAALACWLARLVNSLPLPLPLPGACCAATHLHHNMPPFPASPAAGPAAAAVQHRRALHHVCAWQVPVRRQVPVSAAASCPQQRYTNGLARGLPAAAAGTCCSGGSNAAAPHGPLPNGPVALVSR